MSTCLFFFRHERIITRGREPSTLSRLGKRRRLITSRFALVVYNDSHACDCLRMCYYLSECFSRHFIIARGIWHSVGADTFT